MIFRPVARCSDRPTDLIFTSHPPLDPPPPPHPASTIAVLARTMPCPICFEPISQEHQAVWCWPCGHAAHAQCVPSHVRGERCPLCREPAHAGLDEGMAPAPQSAGNPVPDPPNVILLCCPRVQMVDGAFQPDALDRRARWSPTYTNGTYEEGWMRMTCGSEYRNIGFQRERLQPAWCLEHDAPCHLVLDMNAEFAFYACGIQEIWNSRMPPEGQTLLEIEALGAASQHRVCNHYSVYFATMV